MLTDSEYMFAWLFYLLGAAILMGCWWYLTAKMSWAPVRNTLRITSAVVLLMPWYTFDQQYKYVSPAWLMGAMEGFFQGAPAFWRAGLPLLFVSVLVLLSCILFYCLRWWFRRNSRLQIETSDT